MSADGGVPESEGAVGSLDQAHLAPPLKHRHRSLIIGLVGIVIVIAAVIVGIFVFNETSAALSAGSGTATITWTPAPNKGDTTGNPPQSFGGTIGGHPVTGVSTFALPSTFNPSQGLTPADLHNIQFFRYKGTFAGKPFALGVGVSRQDAFVITGTYDGEKVNAVVGPSPNSNLSSPPVPFYGTIGKWKVTGTVHFAAGTKQTQTARATYTVNS